MLFAGSTSPINSKEGKMYIKVNSSILRAEEVILIRLLNNFSSKFIYLLVYTDILDPLSHG
jgi:hypothetical protein